MSKRMEEEGHTDSRKGSPEKHTKKGILCPVCGSLLDDINLPDQESIVKDNLYHEGGILIENSHIQLRCDFEHQFEKEDITIDDPHELVAVIDAEFDQSGKCVRFDIVEVLPG